MNELDVDQAALAAEAAALEAPADELQPPQAGADQAPDAGAGVGQPGPPLASWADDTPFLCEWVTRLACPAWELTDDEKRALAESLAPVLDRLFPGGIGSEKWAPYFRLLVVAGGIVLARYDSKTRKFRPLYPEKKTAPAIAAPAAVDGAEPEPAAGGASFSTVAG